MQSKQYQFYGWQSDVFSLATFEYPMIKTPRDLYDALCEIWCAETCAPRMRKNWNESNKSLGQCSVTAFLAQDIFGGKVYGILRPGGNYHCYNVVENRVFDLTSEQFGSEKLCYEIKNEQFRQVHFSKEEKKARYELLKSKLKNWCNEQTTPQIYNEVSSNDEVCNLCTNQQDCGEQLEKKFIYSVIDVLKYDRVHDDVADTKNFFAKAVCAEQLEYVSHFKSDKSVILSLGAQYALNQAMSKFMSGFNKNMTSLLTFPLQIKHDKSGCPVFGEKTMSEFNKLNMTPPYFSLSHSGDFAVAVVSEKPVGIDVQKMKYNTGTTSKSASTKYDKIAERFFARDEIKWLSTFDDVKERTEKFFELWTLKEAFLKASGKAGKITMSSFTVEKENENSFFVNYDSKKYSGVILEVMKNLNEKYELRLGGEAIKNYDSYENFDLGKNYKLAIFGQDF